MAKRKKLKVPQKDIISEYDGWSAGDNCYTVFGGESKAALCEIVEFHPNDAVTPSVSVLEVITCKYRCAPMMAIAETSKEAKSLQPAWTKWHNAWKAKEVKKQRKLAIARAKAAKAEELAEEKAKAAAELAEQEAATRKLKEKKNEG